MTRKIVRVGAAAGNHRIAEAIREGQLTRRQFTAWHAQRRSEGKGIVITLRDAPSTAKARRHSARKRKAR